MRNFIKGHGCVLVVVISFGKVVIMPEYKMNEVLTVVITVSKMLFISV